MGTTFTTAIGTPPVCTSLAFRAWLRRLLDYRLAEIPLARATTYYFDNTAGNDTTGNGSQATPYKTLTKAQALHDASSGDIRLRFKRGETWLCTARALNITKANVTVDDYGDGNTQKPKFTRFKAEYGFGWTLTTSQTKTYERAETSDIAFVKLGFEPGDTQNVFAKRASIAEVEAFSGAAFWWDSATSKLYVQMPNAVNPQSFAFVFPVQSVISNQDDGILVGDVDGVRIQNIICEGFGCDRTTPHNGFYPIRLSNLGTNAVLVVGCEAYYSGTHAIGDVDSLGSGGITTYVGCRTGYCLDDAANAETNMVTYRGSGGQETLFYDCVSIGGSLPRDTTLYGGGLHIYGHTSGGAGQTIGLAIAWRCRNEPSRYQNVKVDGFSNVPTFADLADARAFVVDGRFYARTRLTTDPSANFIVGNGTLVDNVYINFRAENRQVGVLPGNSNHVAAVTFEGVLINSQFYFEMKNWVSLDASLGVIVNTAAAFTARAYNCHFNFVHDWRGTIGVSQQNLSSGTAVAGKVFNSIFSARLTQRSTFQPGLGNTAAIQANNAYSRVTTKTGNSGYNNDAYAVETGQVFDDTAPDLQSALVSVNQQLVEGYRLEYDMRWSPRERTTTTIGPIEIERGPRALEDAA